MRIDNTQSSLTMLERAELVDRVQKSLQEIEEVGNTMSAVTFAPPLETKRMGLLSAKSTVRDIWNKRLEAHRAGIHRRRISGPRRRQRAVAHQRPRRRAQRRRLRPVPRTTCGPKSNRCCSAERTRILTERAKAAKEKPNAEDIAAAAAPTADDPSPLGIDAVYTGLVPVVYKAQHQMLVGLGENFIYDLLTIAGVMTLVFRDLSAGLILLVPSVFPVMVVFGLMGWFGVTIDVGTIMTPTVALGVSVDDVVHFLIWYRRGLSEGKSRHDSVMLAYEGCARAMYQSWSVLGLGLAVFALSSFVPTQRFGAMMFCLLTAALVGNLLILPAVLCSPIAASVRPPPVRKGVPRWQPKRRPAKAPPKAAEELPEEQFGLEPTPGILRNRPPVRPWPPRRRPARAASVGTIGSARDPPAKAAPSPGTAPFRHDAPIAHRAAGPAGSGGSCRCRDRVKPLSRVRRLSVYGPSHQR